MAVFDGSTYVRRQAALKDVASSKLCLIEGWFQCEDGEGGTILVGGAGATEYIKLALSTATGFLEFNVKNSAGMALWDITSDTAFDDGELYHFAISVDLGESRGQFYIDADSSAVTTNTALTDGTIAFASATEWVVAADLAGASPFTGSLYEVGFWPGISLDMTDNDELQQVVAEDTDQGLSTEPRRVKPVGYGHEGRYLGGPAAIFHTSGFHKNLGTGGLFTLNGQTDEDVHPDGPSPYRLFPRWPTPGERWYTSEQGGEPYPRSLTVVEQREGLSSFGQRIGHDEVDARTRHERPGFSFSDMVLGIEEEDNEGDFPR